MGDDGSAPERKTRPGTGTDAAPAATPALDEQCDWCGSTNLLWRNCKLICRNCSGIVKSCADL